MALPQTPPSYAHTFKGFGLIRGRDCVMFAKGDSHVVCVNEEMIAKGWSGGTGVQWVDSEYDEPTVGFSRGLYGGFLLYGSDEPADQFTAMSGNVLSHPMAAVMFAGNCLISTSTYERYTYASRTGGGPLVPLAYRPSDPLYFSLDARWTKEDELTLSGAALAPAFFTGFVSNVPCAANQYFLGVQTSL